MSISRHENQKKKKFFLRQHKKNLSKKISNRNLQETKKCIRNLPHFVEKKSNIFENSSQPLKLTNLYIYQKIGFQPLKLQKNTDAKNELHFALRALD